MLFSPVHGTTISIPRQVRNWYKAAHKLTFLSEKDKGKGRGKGKGKGKGRWPARPSHLPLEDRRRRVRGLKAKTECRARGRKRHWANDRECAMSSSSSSARPQTRTAHMATRQQLTDERIKLDRVLIFTNTAMILIHPHVWLDNAYLFREKRPSRYP